MKIALLATLSVLGLAACAPPPGPVVSDYNGDSVKIQELAIHLKYAPEKEKAANLQNMHNEANRICRTGHGKKAELASMKEDPSDIYITNLYLCL